MILHLKTGIQLKLTVVNFYETIKASMNKKKILILISHLGFFLKKNQTITNFLYQNAFKYGLKNVELGSFCSRLTIYFGRIL